MDFLEEAQLMFTRYNSQYRYYHNRGFMRYLWYVIASITLCLSGCDFNAINSPYSEQDQNATILYSSFSLRPKHLDPARSYSSNEATFTGQIYEPPLQYHYLKRPYTLEPLTAGAMPTVSFYSAQNELLGTDDPQPVAYSVYQINIKKGIHYQPHPAFAKDEYGNYLYHHLSKEETDQISALADFEQQATRELIAQDYVYQIKRLANPEIHSPILGLMSEYIVGLGDFATQLQNIKQAGQALDLRQYDIEGVTVIDRYTYQIKVYGKYPQLRYWLAMPFFAPVPWEADVFYQQTELAQKNITLDWYPIGTGPFLLSKNDPNSQMILEKNPNYHDDFYPKQGEKEDEITGLLNDAGKRLPLIDKVVFTLEKENTSYWNKFLQGYYDVSGVSSDSFEQAIDMASSGDFSLSDAMLEKGINLKTAVGTSSYYIGFNMDDPVVGGLSDQAKKLRQAISIAIDYEEFISIFANGRGIAAQGPIPPGIFGYQSGPEGINSNVYDWNDGNVRRKSISDARQLLAQAGYPNGRDNKTGEPLVLYFDVPASGPAAKSEFDWLRKQFQKLDIQLVIRSTDYNRFQDKMRSGQAQLFQWGWNADYPDPENFLFLLYGPNGKVISGGENAANYHNDKFDHLFEQMRVMPDTQARQQIINQMHQILIDDAPWIWGYHPKQLSLFHAWNYNIKPNLMANNILKYRRLDPKQRADLQNQWNKPVVWPLILMMVGIIVILLPAWMMYRNKMNHRIRS